MGKKNVIGIFDIGKTNKKLLLFDASFNEVYREEKKFIQVTDEDNSECDDIDAIEAWIFSSLSALIKSDEFEIKGINFCTYGASLVFIDQNGKRLTPLYNYLKEIPDDIQESLFDKYGGKEEFCRKTASPALGNLLNSGIQILWLKKYKPEIFSQVKSVLHFPQYLSWLFTGKVFSEPTSIGCHTFLWNFDQNCYHEWIADEGIVLPEPVLNSHTENIEFAGKSLDVGIGIHDSSASIVPYMRTCKSRFLLISTGTWCINMNPFNHFPLTPEELNRDCLNFLNVDHRPVKSSRFFMGHIHDMNIKRLMQWFKAEQNSITDISPDDSLLNKYLMNKRQERIFFKEGIPKEYIDYSVDLTQFKNLSIAYHRLMYDLTLLTAESIKLITSDGDGVEHFYVSGGFSKNEIFIHILGSLFPDKIVFTSEIKNSSALGAALVVSHAMEENSHKEINLNARRWKASSKL